MIKIDDLKIGNVVYSSLNNCCQIVIKIQRTKHILYVNCVEYNDIVVEAYSIHEKQIILDKISNGIFQVD